MDLPDPGMPQQDGHLSGQQRRDGVERVVATGDGDREVEVGELRRERLGGRQIALGQTQNGFQPAGVCGDQRALDQAGARRGVGEGDHHQQLIGIGDDDALGGIGVVGGAPQHGSPLTSSHDARQGVRLSRHVTDDADVVADDDRGAAQFAGPHGGDAAVRIAVKRAAPPAAVDGHHHGVVGVGVVRPGLGPRS